MNKGIKSGHCKHKYLPTCHRRCDGNTRRACRLARKLRISTSGWDILGWGRIGEDPVSWSGRGLWRHVMRSRQSRRLWRRHSWSRRSETNAACRAFPGETPRPYGEGWLNSWPRCAVSRRWALLTTDGQARDSCSGNCVECLWISFPQRSGNIGIIFEYRLVPQSVRSVQFMVIFIRSKHRQKLT